MSSSAGPDAEVDLAIIGGGPAGALAAHHARQKGLSVMLIDKARFPRDKLCGGLFTGRSRRIYGESFGTSLPGDLFETRTAISFYMGDRDMGALPDVPAMYLTMRWDMDAHLLGKAIASGADVRTGTRVRHFDLSQDRLKLSDGSTVKYRVLIGADGVNSAVARALYGRAFDPKTIGFALECEMPPEPDPDVAAQVRVDFGVADWGYGWSFPKARSVTVGVGGLQTRNPDLKRRMEDYADALGKGPPAKIKGHFLPFGDFKRRPGRGNVVLVGDAAGFVDPITGEGIAYAMLSGQRSAEAAARAVREGRAIDTAMIYRQATGDIRRSLRIAALLRPIIFSKRMAPVFAGAFARSQRVKSAYMSMLAGDIEYGTILALVLRRLPAALTRAATSRSD